jgi:AAA15 family ATPase/GTPase
MLLRFGVQNHRSISAYQELSFAATSLKDSEEGLLDLPGDIESSGDSPPSRRELRVLPVVAIYGANAAGKSTVLQAFDFFVRGVVTSHRSTANSEGTGYDPFLLDEASRKEPSRYDADIVVDGIRYHYGYEVDGKAVIHEWLYSVPLAAARQTKSRLFERVAGGDPEFYFGKGLRGENKQIAKLVRPNSLFLSVATQNAHPQLKPIYDFFYGKVTRRLDHAVSEQQVADQLQAYFAGEPSRRDTALNFLRAADVGITDIQFSKVSATGRTLEFLSEFEQLLHRHFDEKHTFDKDRVKVQLKHQGASSSYLIDLDEESAGTLSLLQIMGPVFRKLTEGGLLLIDEPNSTLHPLVSRELIRLFTRRKTNPGGAQLLFTTHDTNLLTGGLLRRDQIWFAEKDRNGATHLYSLSDIKVRAGDNMERGYLTGRFGAIPFFGSPFEDCSEHVYQG